ncbi:hypothetical protein HNQ50_000170 [Silvimonas terrae]|uniref:Uncharacterized protein n=1 Tax=Silvimonas terrae TaxID=300266 RepID=A0A840RAU3_9NEIS|nr:hypothetical protein [Silvimonas terrae]MBB5189460.1 hypothetical protein [Silvimonas terrae]
MQDDAERRAADRLQRQIDKLRVQMELMHISFDALIETIQDEEMLEEFKKRAISRIRLRLDALRRHDSSEQAMLNSTGLILDEQTLDGLRRAVALKRALETELDRLWAARDYETDRK